jgi:phage terminase large subunit
MTDNLVSNLQSLTVEQLLQKRISVRASRIRQAQTMEMLREKSGGILRPEMPPAFEFLYDTHTEDGVPVRYKVPKGGRGKGASWNIGRRLLYKGLMQSSLVLCTREVQNSIADSVHRVLKTQIKRLGYQDLYDVQSNKIRSKINDSEFIFRGLNDLTVESIKSMEGVTDVWVAEAETMGKMSWQMLDPTIRETGSQVYVDYNPKRIDAPTNVMFTKNCPDNAIVRHLTFADNPYFPEALEIQRQQALKRIATALNDEDREQAQLDYNHVWLGHCEVVSKSSILGAKYQVESFEPKVDAGQWDGPYDGADWGFGADPTTRVRVWIWTKPDGTKWLCVEREVVLRGSDGMALDLRELPKRFDDFPDARTVKIRGDNSQPQTIGYMRNAGFNIIAADKWKGSVEDGIQHMRGAYTGILVHPRCPATAEECSKYSYKTDRLTGDVLPDIIDDWNHCIDAIRYAIDPLILRKKGGSLFD